MKTILKPCLIKLGMVIAAILLLGVSPSTLAAGNQNQGSSQALAQPAMLIAPNPEFKVNVYPKPTLDQPRIGYGLAGDHITVLEQIGSNEGYAWNHVKFDAPPYIEGWVAGNFISILNADHRSQFSPSTQQGLTQDRYLGSQQNISAFQGNPQQNYQRQQR
jgi:hypothetical protein